MAHAFAPPKVFANAGLKLLKNSLVLAKLADSEGVDKTYSTETGGGKPGGTVYVKRPPEFIVRDGKNAAAQEVLEGEVAVSVDKQKGVDVQFTSLEETLSVGALLKSKVMASSMAALASQIDSDLMATTLEFPNWVGTPGQLVDSAADFFRAPERLDELAIPQTDRKAVLTPSDTYAMAGNLLGLAAQQGEVARNALEKAKIPILGNTDPYMTQTVASLTCGTRTNGAVNGGSQDVAFAAVRTSYQQTLNIDGVGNGGTIKKGEVFSIAGVYAVNPRTKAVLPFLAQFVVLADATANGSGQVALTIANPIIVEGAYQNVSAAPADNAVVTWMGTAGSTYRQNAAFHKTSLKLVSAKLVTPFSGAADYSTDPETGISVRYWRYSNGDSDTHNHRFDVIYGCVNVDRRLGVRLSGAA
ncbi:P22 phage major capsid protein family protein [Phenylobacterium immobile]|uniref:P22 phage major capsid protein family protein n=1 Tax=Phenylobacterium immobile TaxID=21 RepID=UPI000A9A4DAB|nr:P22 phage major capsid protein family protein [Phenylobacterium immobile]